VFVKEAQLPFPRFVFLESMSHTRTAAKPAVENLPEGVKATPTIGSVGLLITNDVTRRGCDRGGERLGRGGGGGIKE